MLDLDAPAPMFSMSEYRDTGNGKHFKQHSHQGALQMQPAASTPVISIHPPDSVIVQDAPTSARPADLQLDAASASALLGPYSIAALTAASSPHNTCDDEFDASSIM